MKVPTQLICMAVFSMLVAQGFSQAANSTSTGTSGTGTQSGSGLTCYACTSFLKEQNCDSPDEDTPTQECAVGEDMCRKVEQHIIIEGDEKVRTYRECARSGELGECLERTGTNKFKSWYCQCKGKLCNGAGTSVVSFALLASMITALFCLKNRV